MEYHDRASGPPRAQFDRALGEPETELQATAREILTELGYVWVGDCSGWEVVPTVPKGQFELGLELRHRCGWSQLQPFEGVTGDGAAYVGNILERLLEANQGHVCAPHEPSPEHQARVARWSAAAGLTPTGDVAQDQLALVRAMVSKGPRPTEEDDEGEPLIKPLTGFDVFLANRYMPNRPVDGPGCTPVHVRFEVRERDPSSGDWFPVKGSGSETLKKAEAMEQSFMIRKPEAITRIFKVERDV